MVCRIWWHILYEVINQKKTAFEIAILGEQMTGSSVFILGSKEPVYTTLKEWYDFAIDKLEGQKDMVH